MTTKPTIRGDRLILGMLSVIRTLIVELEKAGAIDITVLLAAIDDTVIAHREHGDPNHLAAAIETIAQHLRDSVSIVEKRDH
jgi:hypothetical protein